MVVGRLQVLGHHPYVADHRHEVGVAIPARDDVHVQVVGDACARRAPEVHSDVEPLRVDRSAEAPRRVSGQPKEGVVLFVREPFELGLVPHRNHQQVSRGERKPIENDIGVLGRHEHESFFERVRRRPWRTRRRYPALLWRGCTPSAKGPRAGRTRPQTSGDSAPAHLVRAGARGS